MRNLFVKSALEEGGVMNLFRSIDRDLSSGISIKELRLYLGRQGQEYLFEGMDLEMIHQSIDVSGDGTLSLAELSKFIGHLRHAPDPDKKVTLERTLFNSEVKTLQTRVGGWEEVRREQVLASPVRGSNTANRDRAWANSQFEMLEKIQATISNPRQQAAPPLFEKQWAEMNPQERHEHKIRRHEQKQRARGRARIKLLDSLGNTERVKLPASPVVYPITVNSNIGTLPVSSRAKNMRSRDGDYHKTRSENVLTKMRERGEEYSGGFRSMDCCSIAAQCARKTLPKDLLQKRR
jgi:hypothetical protein